MAGKPARGTDMKYKDDPMKMEWQGDKFWVVLSEVRRNLALKCIFPTDIWEQIRGDGKTYYALHAWSWGQADEAAADSDDWEQKEEIEWSTEQEYEAAIHGLKYKYDLRAVNKRFG
ncbi:hypothetical protein CBER1_03389 [Cercospora berteroae]|uniref:Uncharacterized protein n=1 Tax=Cercospora berteroae TaxID=357750 RepID=A0A2S6C8K1_9PEZI|nr:hypothetical protein CBER1_03389 [Cercospora berteroae]